MQDSEKSKELGIPAGLPNKPRYLLRAELPRWYSVKEEKKVRSGYGTCNIIPGPLPWCVTLSMRTLMYLFREITAVQ